MSFDTFYMQTPFHWNIHWFLLLHPLNAFCYWFSLLEMMKFEEELFRLIPAFVREMPNKRILVIFRFSTFLVRHTARVEAKTCLPIFNWADLIKTHISSQCENGGGNGKWGDGNYFVSLITHEIFISHHIKILANCKNITNERTIVSKIPFLLALAFCERNGSNDKMLGNKYSKMRKCSAFYFNSIKSDRNCNISSRVDWVRVCLCGPEEVPG